MQKKTVNAEIDSIFSETKEEKTRIEANTEEGDEKEKRVFCGCSQGYNCIAWFAA